MRVSSRLCLNFGLLSLVEKPSENLNKILRKEFAPIGANSFLKTLFKFSEDLPQIEKGGKIANGRVASPENDLFTLNLKEKPKEQQNNNNLNNSKKRTRKKLPPENCLHALKANSRQIVFHSFLTLLLIHSYFSYLYVTCIPQKLLIFSRFTI